MLKSAYYKTQSKGSFIASMMMLLAMGSFIGQAAAATTAGNAATTGNGLKAANNSNSSVYHNRYEDETNGFQFVDEVWKDKKGNLFFMDKYLTPPNDTPAFMPDVTVMDKEPSGNTKQMMLMGSNLQVIDEQTGNLSFYKYYQRLPHAKAVCLENLEPGKQVEIFMFKDKYDVPPVVVPHVEIQDYRSYPTGGDAPSYRTEFNPDDIIATPGSQIFDPSQYSFLRKALTANDIGCYKDAGTIELQKLTPAETTALWNSLSQKDKDVIEKEKNDLKTPVGY